MIFLWPRKEDRVGCMERSSRTDTGTQCASGIT